MIGMLINFKYRNKRSIIYLLFKILVLYLYIFKRVNVGTTFVKPGKCVVESHISIIEIDESNVLNVLNSLGSCSVYFPLIIYLLLSQLS